MEKDPKTYDIIGAAMEVHRIMGPGHLEAVYHEYIVEIKAEKALCKEDEAQIINSLKSRKHRIGLLINFGEASLRYRRFINSSST